MTLLFRLVAAANAQAGRVVGTVSAGVAMSVTVTVDVNVQPPPVRDDVLLLADADRIGFLGLWFHPIVDVQVTNSGTSSRPVTLRLDQPAVARRSSQDVDCTTDGGTTCVTTAELAPGEKLKVSFKFDADWWLLKSPNQTQVHISATLGEATDDVTVTIWDCCPWPTAPGPPTTPNPPSAPPVTTLPGTPPTTQAPPPSSPSSPSSPSPGSPPVATTPPPSSTQPPDPGPPEAPPSGTPSTSEPRSGGLGGLLGWLLGG